jgi:hypothetical protein
MWNSLTGHPRHAKTQRDQTYGSDLRLSSYKRTFPGTPFVWPDVRWIPFQVFTIYYWNWNAYYNLPGNY